MKKLIALLAGVLLAPLALAQDDTIDSEATAEEPQRRYTVEVIIFAYAEDVSVGTEIFLPDDPPPVEGLLLDEDGNPIDPGELQTEIPVFGDDVVVEDETAAEEELPPAWVVGASELPVLVTGDQEPNPFQLVLLTEDEFTLTDAADRFELLDAYETLLHFGWTQPTFPEEETPAIELPLLAEPPPGLNGTLTLYLSRYLHLVVDLSLEQQPGFADPVAIDEPVPVYSDGRGRAGYDVLEPAPVRFRINEDRIFKSGDRRYFDHPKFGVLAQITRVEEPEEEDDEAGLVGQFGE